MTHEELVERAGRWLRNSCHCGVVLKEIVSYAYEIPDAIGFKSDHSILIECKTSLNDFRTDLKKPFRNVNLGIGNYRFYMCAEGVLRPEIIPKGWGLLWVKGNRISIIRGKDFLENTFPNNEWYRDKDYKQEYLILYSALRRLQVREVRRNNA